MPASLNIADLKRSIEKSVIGLGTVDPDPSYFPDHGIIGFVIRDPNLNGFDAEPVDKATATEVGDFGKPITVPYGKDILIGFIPTQFRKL